MTTNGGGWLMFALLESGNNNILDSQPIGQNSNGSIGIAGYSLALDNLHNESDTSFDVMIQYGDTSTYDWMLSGFTKNAESFFTSLQKVEMENMDCWELEMWTVCLLLIVLVLINALIMDDDYFNFSTSAEFA